MGRRVAAQEASHEAIAIRLTIALDTEASKEQQAKLIAVTERYCVVYQTISRGCPIDVSMSPS